VRKKPVQLMAFDFGSRHIGVAIGQSITASAAPLTRVQANNGIPDWHQLDTLVTTWQPDAFVVGLPLNMDGTDSAMSLRAQKFANRLADRFNKQAFMMDERLSSHESKQLFRERNKKAQEIDSMAAAVILESWFASQKEIPESETPESTES